LMQSSTNSRGVFGLTSGFSTETGPVGFFPNLSFHSKIPLDDRNEKHEGESDSDSVSLEIVVFLIILRISLKKKRILVLKK